MRSRMGGHFGFASWLRERRSRPYCQTSRWSLPFAPWRCTPGSRAAFGNAHVDSCRFDCGQGWPVTAPGAQDGARMIPLAAISRRQWTLALAALLVLEQRYRLESRRLAEGATWRYD